MCCLKYEQDAYEDLVKRAPKMDSFVETPDGVGTVSSINLLRQKVNVRLEDDPETPHCYHNCEVCVVRSGKGKRPEGYVPPSPEELAKLRRVEDIEDRSERQPEDRLSAALAQVLSHDEPSQPDQPVQEREEHRRRRNRGRGRGPKPEGEKPAEAPEKDKPTQAKPAQNEPKSEGGEKKPNRNRNHRRRHRKPGAGQGGAPAQE